MKVKATGSLIRTLGKAGGLMPDRLNLGLNTGHVFSYATDLIAYERFQRSLWGSGTAYRNVK